MTALDHPTLAFVTPDLSPAALAAVTLEIAQYAPEYDRTGEVPVRGLEAAHRAGLLTATVGTRFGGPELGERDVHRILVALGEGDASVALLVANNLGAHTQNAQQDHWPSETYADFLRKSVEGVALSNAVRAEPDLGAPSRGGLPATTARWTEDGWLLNGHKAYATGGEALTYHLVWVVVDEPDVERPRVGHLIVPGDATGITWIKTWDHLGLRASNTNDVVYENVLVPHDAFLEIPRRPDGAYIDPSSALSTVGLGHAALYIGVARAARSAFTAFANDRVPSALGRPIATTERIQQVAGEIEAQIAQAEAILYGTALRIEAGETDVAAQVNVLKVQIVRSVITAVQTASAALGNPGLTRHLPFERLLRDALASRVHPPQEDWALIATGRRVLGA
ncbi:MAG: acyl-CoA dehydrogenase family protein [Microbacterium sp.]